MLGEGAGKITPTAWTAYSAVARRLRMVERTPSTREASSSSMAWMERWRRPEGQSPTLAESYKGGQLENGPALGGVEAVGLLLRGAPGFRLRMEGPAPVEAKRDRTQTGPGSIFQSGPAQDHRLVSPGKCLAGRGRVPDAGRTALRE